MTSQPQVTPQPYGRMTVETALEIAEATEWEGDKRAIIAKLGNAARRLAARVRAEDAGVQMIRDCVAHVATQLDRPPADRKPSELAGYFLELLRDKLQGFGGRLTLELHDTRAEVVLTVRENNGQTHITSVSLPYIQLCTERNIHGYAAIVRDQLTREIGQDAGK